MGIYLCLPNSKSVDLLSFWIVSMHASALIWSPPPSAARASIIPTFDGVRPLPSRREFRTSDPIATPRLRQCVRLHAWQQTLNLCLYLRRFDPFAKSSFKRNLLPGTRLSTTVNLLDIRNTQKTLINNQMLNNLPTRERNFTAAQDTYTRQSRHDAFAAEIHV